MDSVKRAVEEIATHLPEGCTWDEVMERIYVRQKIEAGLADVEAGRTTSHEDVFAEFADGDDPVG